jgi:hypothetical protein
VYEAAHVPAIYEANDAVNFGKKRVIFAAAYVPARLQTRAALADDDRSAGYELSAESFYSEPLCIRVAAIF